MGRSDKCDVSKTHISSNCRKLDTSDVKGKILNRINSVHLKNFESKVSNSFRLQSLTLKGLKRVYWTIISIAWQFKCYSF